MYSKPILDEFVKLCGFRIIVEGGLPKVAALSSDEAKASLGRLDELENVRQGELGRGALVGAVAGPLIATTGRLVSGAKRPGNVLRQTAAEMTTGAAFGGALPFTRNRLERTVEREKLKGYLEGGSDRTLRNKIRRSVGV